MGKGGRRWCHLFLLAGVAIRQLGDEVVDVLCHLQEHVWLNL